MLCREKNLHEREWRVIATEDKALKRRQKELPSQYEEFVQRVGKFDAVGKNARSGFELAIEELKKPVHQIRFDQGLPGWRSLQKTSSCVLAIWT